MRKTKTTWTEEGFVIEEPIREEKQEYKHEEKQETSAKQRKGGHSEEKEYNYGRKQSIEELTGNKIQKKK